MKAGTVSECLHIKSLGIEPNNVNIGKTVDIERKNAPSASSGVNNTDESVSNLKRI
jgi:hypothetical protein